MLNRGENMKKFISFFIYFTLFSLINISTSFAGDELPGNEIKNPSGSGLMKNPAMAAGGDVTKDAALKAGPIAVKQAGKVAGKAGSVVTGVLTPSDTAHAPGHKDMDKIKN